MDTTTRQPALPVATQEELPESPEPSAPVPSDKTPQEFYAEITRRADIRAVLEELATG